MLSRVARRGPGFCCCHALRLSQSPFARLMLSSPSRCVCYPSPQLLLYVVWGVAIGQGVSAAHRLSIPFRVPPRPSLILVGCRVISCTPLGFGGHRWGVRDAVLSLTSALLLLGSHNCLLRPSPAFVHRQPADFQVEVSGFSLSV